METEEIKITSPFELLKPISLFSREKVDGRSITPRALLIDEIFIELNISKSYKRGLHFQCANLTDNEIRDCFDRAKKWKANPSALFRKLIKGKAKEISLRLSQNMLY